MIGVLQREYDVTPGVCSGQAQRQVVRLATGVDEEDHAERVGEQGNEAAGVFDDRRMQVSGVGVQDAGLFAQRRDDTGMAVPDMRHVVDKVEVAAPVVGDQLRPLPGDDPQRLGVAQRERGGQVGTAVVHDPVAVPLGHREA